MNTQTIPRIILSFLFTSFFAIPAQAEILEVSTFVATPQGHYQTLLLNPHAEGTTLGCDEGRMYVNTDGELQICQDDGAGSTNYTSPAGAWTLSGSDIYTKASISDPLVGIGTTEPLEMFHIEDGNILAVHQPGGLPTQNNVFYFDTTNAALIAGYTTTALASLSGSTGSWSQTFGYENLSSGNYAFTAGQNNAASDDHAVAMGNSNTASGSNALTLGRGNTASGDAGTAIGMGAVAAGLASTAIGQSTATGIYSFAAGSGNVAAGDYSAVIGYNNSTNNGTLNAATQAAFGATASVVGAFAAGVSNAARGIGSSAIGNSNTVTGNYSSALGNGITVTGQASVGIGVGAAAKTFNTSSAFAVMGGPTLLTYSTTIPEPTWSSKAINTSLVVYGATYMESAPSYYSDKRGKKDVQEIKNSLEKIRSLRPVQYKIFSPREKDGVLEFDPSRESMDKNTHIGLIAQEVYEIFPNIVYKPEDESKDTWAIRYEELIPVVIQAVKEHKTETDELKARIEQLEAQIRALQQ